MTSSSRKWHRFGRKTSVSIEFWGSTSKVLNSASSLYLFNWVSTLFSTWQTLLICLSFTGIPKQSELSEHMSTQLSRRAGGSRQRHVCRSDNVLETHAFLSEDETGPNRVPAEYAGLGERWHYWRRSAPPAVWSMCSCCVTWLRGAPAIWSWIPWVCSTPSVKDIQCGNSLQQCHTFTCINIATSLNCWVIILN